MNSFSMTEMEMLTEGGYSGGFMEDIAEGDEVAIKTGFGREDEDAIKFVTVAELRLIPRYERDHFGSTLSEHPNYLAQFVGVHASGLREPMSFGAGWAIFRRPAEQKVAA